MEKQLGFSELDLRKNHYKTRIEVFLEKIEALISWARLVALIEPYYPKAGNDRRPCPLSQCYGFTAFNNGIS
ncbi:MAG: IS4 family transposase [Osedax symbiont Rs2]|nr:MAG: IS4 family transposase [Osedax symbiont Rs2]